MKALVWIHDQKVEKEYLLEPEEQNSDEEKDGECSNEDEG